MNPDRNAGDESETEFPAVRCGVLRLRIPIYSLREQSRGRDVRAAVDLSVVLAMERASVSLRWSSGATDAAQILLLTAVRADRC
jgi:hypothetical protein